MKVRKLHKQRLKNIPRASYHEGKRPRKNATYFNDYCCKQCYFDWGRWYDEKFLYQHDCAKSNYDGKLKKYWITDRIEVEKIMHRLKLIEENYKKAVEHINRCLTDDKYPKLQAITKLFMETDVNPYRFLSEHFAGGFDTAGGLSSLLGMINHALYDDGDISFPIVNGEPRIAFLHHTDDCYEDFVLSETEKHFKKNYGHEYEVKRCVDIFDFIAKFEEHHSKEVRNWFITEASRRSIEFAVEHFSHYARFDPDWEFDEQIRSEIEQKRQKLIANGMLKEQK